MFATQIKGFALLILVLLIVDALAYQGQYRVIVGGRLVSFASAVSPTHWTGMGEGRDWREPGPHR
jgi:hypothetical protein